MPGSQASASQEQGSAQVQAALAELEWAQVLESQAEPELDLLAGMDSQERESAEKAASAQEREPGSQEQESQAAQACQPQSSAHTHARSRHT